jgi:hypothetical protein
MPRPKGNGASIWGNASGIPAKGIAQPKKFGAERAQPLREARVAGQMERREAEAKAKALFAAAAEAAAARIAAGEVDRFADLTQMMVAAGNRAYGLPKAEVENTGTGLNVIIRRFSDKTD